jgi:glycosyltransferase involved in cell wall biosynthesis
MPPSPAISVVMPVRDGGVYLAAAVESILAQDFGDFEFVIVDDGSTDQTPAALALYAARDPRIRLFRQNGVGIVGALNYGMAQTRADLIARMDADDVALPPRLGRQFHYLHDHPDCVALGSRILLIDADGWPIRQMCEEQTHAEIDATNLRGGGAAINHPAVMFRTAAFRSLGGYRQEMIYAEDLDLWLRMAEIGRLHNLPQVLLHYRMHARSIGHARAIQQHEQWRRAAVEAHQRRGTAADPAGGVQEKASTPADHHMRWAWWALIAGNVRTARKHALTALRLRPLSIDSWRLAACAVRGH